MQDSLSLLNLQNPKPRSSYVSSRLSESPIFIRSNTPQMDPLWKMSENSKNFDPRIMNQQIESKYLDRDSYNASNFSSRKRLILKNKHKFPSDFFNSVHINNNHQEPFEKRQKNRIESLCPKLLIPKALRSSELDSQMFTQASPNVHETPKFISDVAPQSEDAHLLQNRVNNGNNCSKDSFKIPNDSLDLIRRLDSSRIQSALLPNTRMLRNHSETTLSGHSMQNSKNENQVKGVFSKENSPLIFNETLGDKARTLSRVSSQEFLQRYAHQEHYSKSKEINNKDVQTAPENKTRTIVLKNKLLEDLIMMRRKSISITSNENQGVFPRIRNDSASLENLPFMRIKLEGNQDLSQQNIKQEEKGPKYPDYRLRPTENIRDKNSIGDNSPLPYLVKRNEVQFFVNRTKSHELISSFHPSLIQSKVISYDDTRLNKSSQAPINEFDIDEKRDESKNNEQGEKLKEKILAHRRHASMDSENCSLACDQFNQKVKGWNQIDMMKKRAFQSVIKQRVPRNYLSHFSVDLRKSSDLKDEVVEENNRSVIPNTVENRKNVTNVLIDAKDTKKRVVIKKEIKEDLPKEDQTNKNQESEKKQGSQTRQRGFTFGNDEKNSGKSQPLQVINIKTNIMTENRKELNNDPSYNKLFKSASKEAKTILQKVEMIKNQKEERNNVLRLVKH